MIFQLYYLFTVLKIDLSNINIYKEFVALSIVARFKDIANAINRIQLFISVYKFIYITNLTKYIMYLITR